MGVPKFFCYMLERYPCLIEFIMEHQIPEYDNLYLDMNGIIHMCSHPNDADLHFRLTEDRLFEEIFHYIEFLFFMIKPRKLFFMAVDGVAPRAKMNQQRGRRFRTAREVAEREAKALESGETLPEEAAFDSNCITPGTEFMTKLNEQLRYFVVKKISTECIWQQCEVILSGHEVPGEGEHKIMDYIRYLRSQPNYDPNIRHCLYGLDADLIMLGLCSHDPHFSLLREEIKFGRQQKRIHAPEQIRFCLFHLSLMREYIDLEFQELKTTLTKFKYDLEHIIDDWVLMGFLVGNDFIPHLPNMHINHGALPILYKAYMETLPTLDGYINEWGVLNLERFEVFMQRLAQFDVDNYDDVRSDLLYMEEKMGKKSDPTLQDNQDIISKTFDKHEEECRISDAGLTDLISKTEEMFAESSDEDVTDDEENAGFKSYKKSYYHEKLEIQSVTEEVLREQAEGYIKAIQWNLYYYYHGCCSWSWYYPQHYSPYISDIKGFKNMKIEFSLDRPFKPFEQLLAVLPSASRQLLPKAYQDLMTDENSAIKSFYPKDFATDLNGKRQEWEAVVLVPFIDEKLLLRSMEPCTSLLTDEEVQRNQFGPMLSYMYDKNSNQGVYHAPNYFPPVRENRAICKSIYVDEIRVPKDKLVLGAYPGAKFEVFYPGFPTMVHLPFEGRLMAAGIKVFNRPATGETMILSVLPKENDLIPLSQLPESFVKNLLNQVVYIGWPLLTEAKVSSISDQESVYRISQEDNDRIVHTQNRSSLFTDQVKAVKYFFKNKLGVVYDQVLVLVHVKIVVGRKYHFCEDGTVELHSIYSSITTNIPLQGVVSNITTIESLNRKRLTITDILSPGSVCFVITNPYYGSRATVLNSGRTINKNQLKLSLEIFEEPDFTEVTQCILTEHKSYISQQSAASCLAISTYILSRITGSITMYIGDEKPQPNVKLNEKQTLNVGLNLRFTKRNLETPGYTKKHENTWYYSLKTVEIVKEYMRKFPEVFTALANVTNEEGTYYDFSAQDVFTAEHCKDKLNSLSDWLRTVSSFGVEKSSCDSNTLTPRIISVLESVVDAHKDTPPKQIIMHMNPRFLHMPLRQIFNTAPDPTATHELLDRVVNIRESYVVPLGLKGTIVAIHVTCSEADWRNPKDDKEVAPQQMNALYDVVFDECFENGTTLLNMCSERRGYRMTANAFINITHGVRMMERKTGKPGHLRAMARANQESSQTFAKFHNRDTTTSTPRPTNPTSTTSAFATFNRNTPHYTKSLWTSNNMPPQFTSNNPIQPTVGNSFYRSARVPGPPLPNPYGQPPFIGYNQVPLPVQQMFSGAHWTQNKSMRNQSPNASANLRPNFPQNQPFLRMSCGANSMYRPSGAQSTYFPTNQLYSMRDNQSNQSRTRIVAHSTSSDTEYLKRILGIPDLKNANQRSVRDNNPMETTSSRTTDERGNNPQQPALRDQLTQKSNAGDHQTKTISNVKLQKKHDGIKDVIDNKPLNETTPTEKIPVPPKNWVSDSNQGNASNWRDRSVKTADQSKSANVTSSTSDSTVNADKTSRRRTRIVANFAAKPNSNNDTS